MVTTPSSYTVVAGDSLWSISQRYEGSGTRWPELYRLNAHVIGPDPNDIYPGQRFKLPARSRTASTTPDDDDQASPGPRAAEGGSGHLSGTLGCSGLEALWQSAGGPRRAAFTAAEVAMAESGGRQYATGPAGERGYWQINPDHGSLSTYDPYGNARAAVLISDGGSNWSAWTTYVDGAYLGRCLSRGVRPREQVDNRTEDACQLTVPGTVAERGHHAEEHAHGHGTDVDAHAAASPVTSRRLILRRVTSRVPLSS